MAKQTVSIKIDDADLRGLQRAIFRMQKAAKDDIKDDVLKIAQEAVPLFQRAAQTYRQREISAMIKARKDVTPVVEFGGSGRAGVSGNATYSQMLFGVEFGANQGFLSNGGKSFPARSPRQGRGNKGYWIFPTAKKIQPMISRRWYQSVDSVLDKWVPNG